VKLYPSCAATHPPLDALLALKTKHGLTAENIAAIDVEVDSMTPRLLIHDRPTTALEAKFSMPFCAVAAIVFGAPSLDTFDVTHIQDSRVQRLLPAVTLRTNSAFDAAAPLSQANVTVKLKDGRVVSERADGARGYPGKLTAEELSTKFMACARRSLTEESATRALAAAQGIESLADVRTLTESLSTGNLSASPPNRSSGRIC
jgi:2-methylcitrate dehydratase PrpD